MKWIAKSNVVFLLMPDALGPIKSFQFLFFISIFHFFSIFDFFFNFCFLFDQLKFLFLQFIWNFFTGMIDAVWLFPCTKLPYIIFLVNNFFLILKFWFIKFILKLFSTGYLVPINHSINQIRLFSFFDRDNLLSIEHLLTTMRQLSKIPDDARLARVEQVLKMMDIDKDGNIELEHALKVFFHFFFKNFIRNILKQRGFSARFFSEVF